MKKLKNLPFDISKEDILKQFSYLDDYPQCKIQEYFELIGTKSLNKYYEPLSSNKQISSIIKIAKNERSSDIEIYGMGLITRLLSILGRRNNTLIGALKIFEFIKSNKTDSEIYKFLRQFIRHQIGGNVLDKKIKCNNKTIITQVYNYHLRKYKDVINDYLDIGCGDCIKTKLLGKLLELKNDNVYGVDFEDFNEKTYNKPTNIQFIYLENKKSYPFKDNMFGLVTCFMVLHHITENLEFTLKEINRVLKIGGIFMITEHDNFNKADDMLADIEHAMWNIVYSPKPNYSFLKEKDYAIYYNWVEWDYIIQKFGFKYENAGMLSKSISLTISPTSSLYGLYSKVKDLKDDD